MFLFHLQRISLRILLFFSSIHFFTSRLPLLPFSIFPSAFSSVKPKEFFSFNSGQAHSPLHSMLISTHNEPKPNPETTAPATASSRPRQTDRGWLTEWVSDQWEVQEHWECSVVLQAFFSRPLPSAYILWHPISLPSHTIACLPPPACFLTNPTPLSLPSFHILSFFLFINHPR